MPYLDPPMAAADPPSRSSGTDPLRGWIGVVRWSQDPCLVLRDGGTVAACSPPVVPLLGLPDPITVTGRHLLDVVGTVIGFTGSGDRLSDWELRRIPPLRALATGALCRAALRVRTAYGIRTVDAVAVPLNHGAVVVGSLTFFHQV